MVYSIQGNEREDGDRVSFPSLRTGGKRNVVSHHITDLSRQHRVGLHKE